MNIIEIIENIDKSEKNKHWVNIEKLSQELSDVYLGYPEKENERITAYFFAKWYCTDTWVGGRIYFLDDEAVDISWQSARKADENFDWISEDGMNNTYNYILSLYEIQKPQGQVIDPEKLKEDIGMGFYVEYGGQLMTDKLIYKETGEIVEVVETWGMRTGIDSVDKWHIVKVKFKSGEEKEVSTKELLAPYEIVGKNEHNENITSKS